MHTEFEKLFKKTARYQVNGTGNKESWRDKEKISFKKPSIMICFENNVTEKKQEHL